MCPVTMATGIPHLFFFVLLNSLKKGLVRTILSTSLGYNYLYCKGVCSKNGFFTRITSISQDGFVRLICNFRCSFLKMHELCIMSIGFSRMLNVLIAVR